MAMTAAQKTDAYRFFAIAFNAAPGATYMSQLFDAYSANMTTLQIVNIYTTKPEFTATYPVYLSDTDFATKLVNNIVKASASAANKAQAVSDIVGYLAIAGNTRGGAIYTIFNNLANKALTDPDWGATAKQMNNQVTVSQYYTETLVGNSTTLSVLQGVIANVTDTTDVSTSAAIEAAIGGAGGVGQTFTLTTGIDNITGGTGNDTINAAATTSNTWSALDNVDGGAGTDTINITLFAGTLAAAGATIKNVEVANVTAAAAITEANTTGFTGLTTLNVGSGAAIAGVVASATTDINVAAGIAGVTVNGGKNVSVTNSTAGNVVVGTTTAAAGTITAKNTWATGTVDVKGAGAITVSAKDGAIGVTNGATVNASSAAGDAVALATRTANTDAQTAATAVSNAAGTAGTAWTADQTAGTLATALATLAGKYTAAHVDSDTVAEHKALTLAELTAGRITLADKVAIDNAYVAAFTAVGGTATLAQAAALALITPIKAAADAAKVVTAAALVTAKTATIAADAVVTADGVKAALVDGVVLTATTNTALTSATLSGNYGSAGNAITDASTQNNTLTSVTLDNAGATTITGKAVTSVTASGMTADVTVTNATAGHTQTFTLSGVTAGTYADATATTINLVGNGTATNVLTALTGTAATKINVTGAGGVQFSAANSDVAAVIDASGSSGTNKVTVLVGQKYTGGSGADTVTASTAATVQAVTVDGGAGTDTLVLGHVTNFGTTGAAKFLNFEAITSVGLDVDLSKFTGSTIVTETISGAVTLSGMNAAQALGVKIAGNTTPVFTVTGATTPGQLDVLTTTMTADSTLTTPSLLGVETWNIVANKTFTTADISLASALTNMNVTGSKAVSITTAGLAVNTNSVIDASALTGTFVFNAAASTTNGLKIVGSATKANTLTASTTATQASILTGGSADDTITGGANSADTITGGAGNNTIDGKGGADTITVGDGNNSINAGGVAYVGVLKVTAGNGYNTIVGGASADVITVGTGGNTITGGAGADVITFAANGVGVTNNLVLSGNADTQVGVVATGFTYTGDVVTGVQTGDTLDFATLANLVLADGVIAVGTTFATATANLVTIVSGAYNTTTGVFTAGAASATNNDYLVQYNGGATTTTVQSELLVDIVGTVTANALGEVVTLTVV